MGHKSSPPVTTRAKIKHFVFLSVPDYDVKTSGGRHENVSAGLCHVSNFISILWSNIWYLLLKGKTLLKGGCLYLFTVLII